MQNKIYSLGIHTTSPELGLSISNFAEDTRSQTWELGYDLSNSLHQYLQEIIHPQTWKDLKFIAVACGPGGFTGTRIGVVAARTLAQQLDIPLFTISTLAGLVWSKKDNYISINYNQECEKISLAVEMKASRGQLFVAIFEVNSLGLSYILRDTVMKPEDWQEKLEKLDKNPEKKYELIRASTNLGWTVDSILALAHLNWQKGLRPNWYEALPFYGQHPIE